MQILIKLGNGVLAFVRPIGERLKDEADADYYSRIASVTIEKCTRDGQPGWRGSVVVALVPDEVVDTADWKFRDAWDWTSPEMKMDYDLVKCREIHRGRMRRLRLPKLRELDAEYLRADELADAVEKSRIAALKQKLRDVTDDPRIDAAKTLDELRAAWPEVLK